MKFFAAARPVPVRLGRRRRRTHASRTNKSIVFALGLFVSHLLLVDVVDSDKTIDRLNFEARTFFD